MLSKTTSITDDILLSEDEVLDLVHAEIASRPQIELKPVHRFAPGRYSRELFMPAGMEIISKWHKSRHNWVVIYGVVDVYVKGKGWERIIGPAWGVTEPDTRRVLRTHEPTLWITLHETDIFPKENTQEAIEEAALMVEKAIIKEHHNPYLGEGKKQEVLK